MRTATVWLHYYRANSLQLLEVRWDTVQALTLEERRAIAKSIASGARVWGANERDAALGAKPVVVRSRR